MSVNMTLNKASKQVKNVQRATAKGQAEEQIIKKEQSLSVNFEITNLFCQVQLLDLWNWV